MDTQFLGIVIGGFVPAVLFAASGIFNKLGAQSSIGLSAFIFFAGLGGVLSSLPFLFLQGGSVVSLKTSIFPLLMGVTWGLGIGCVTLGMQRFHAPLSRLVPLYNMNTLLVVLVSLFFFAEWKDVQVLKLLIGAIFVVIGGTLVSIA